ncbi:uncharacterized protein LOC113294224 [Papaver somniferum]|uniref:uncharacterized protein LOC113294224 n=1 Tax=Papaver somniferum TaxID=3469 RepID=UPI000E6FD627|nr:uncharacterized protein LOC113294224 [Papaver somniferum]
MPLTPEEIKNDVFQMDGKKDPGPDGFTGLFYQKHWDIVGDAVVDMTQTCFRTGNIAKVFNHTNITLIPKVPLAELCVSTVSYSILLNGIPTGFFQPERGLRQGDPLSPYLYIICSEALSSYIDSLQKKGVVEGIKVCKDSPEMTHLLFADDSLLKIPEHRKALLANILDIQSRDLGEKYLGTPTVFQASKIQTHKGILQAIDARISIWLHKLLSQAARTTLIKHIGQAIPLFQMRAFLIPKHICKQMDSHLCKFWWGETLDPKDRKLHFLGWDILCSPKAEGGLGFRKAELNNLAMLARNAWRILENPNCLLVTVLEAKYFPRTDFLNAK